MSKKPETLFKEKVKRGLRQLENCWHVKTHQKAVRGTPDILACINGRFVALELKKTQHEEPTELQKYNIAKIIRCKGIGLFPSPETWDKDLMLLKKLTKK